MAYRCTGRSNDELVSNLCRHKIIHTDRVEQAFRRVDRRHYVIDERDAYKDAAQITKANATISAPHMHAHAVECLQEYLQPGAKVLDVGSGSGYLCAVFHQLVCADGQKGKVVGIDHIQDLLDWSVNNLTNDGFADALDSGEIELICADGRKGWDLEAPFDAIHIGAAADQIPPALLDQLSSPGRMFVPVGIETQEVTQVDKSYRGDVTDKTLFGVVYIPLTDAKTQLTTRN